MILVLALELWLRLKLGLSLWPGLGSALGLELGSEDLNGRHSLGNGMHFIGWGISYGNGKFLLRFITVYFGNYGVLLRILRVFPLRKSRKGTYHGIGNP